MIYFLKADKRVKIGYASDPSNRISQIQTSSSHVLEVLLIIDGNRDEERELHARFRNLRRSGEWFQFEEPIRSYIESNIHRDRKYEFGLAFGDFEGNEQVLRLRTKNGISTAKLGEMLNVSQQRVCEIQAYERNRRVTIRTLQRVADVLGYNFEYRFVPKRTEEK